MSDKYPLEKAFSQGKYPVPTDMLSFFFTKRPWITVNPGSLPEFKKIDSDHVGQFFLCFCGGDNFWKSKNLAYFSFADINVPFENLIHTAIL